MRYFCLILLCLVVPGFLFSRSLAGNRPADLALPPTESVEKEKSPFAKIRLDDENLRIGDFSLSADGQRLAILSSKGEVTLWSLKDAASEKAQSTRCVQAHNILMIQLSHDGGCLLCSHGGENPCLQLLDSSSGEKIWSRDTPGFWATLAVFGDDAKSILAGGCKDGVALKRGAVMWNKMTANVLRLDVKDGHTLEEYDNAKYIRRSAYPGELLALGESAFGPVALSKSAAEENTDQKTEDEKIRYLWDIRSGQLLRKLDERETLPACLAFGFSPEGGELSIASSKGALLKWNLDYGNGWNADRSRPIALSDFLTSTKNYVAAEISAGGNAVAFQTEDHGIEIYRLN